MAFIVITLVRNGISYNHSLSFSPVLFCVICNKASPIVFTDTSVENSRQADKAAEV